MRQYLTEEEKWKAFVFCDADLDGSYYVAVKSTGIFCRPSCKARTPLRKNVTFYDTAEQAMHAGYRPCKRCRPDLCRFAPLEDAAAQCRATLDARFLEQAPLEALLAGLGISPRYLSLLFTRAYGVTPVEYRNRLRVEAAGRMLRETDLSVTDIALSCGFNSLSAFYAAFRRHMGVSPRACRANSKGEA